MGFLHNAPVYKGFGRVGGPDRRDAHGRGTAGDQGEVFRHVVNSDTHGHALGQAHPARR